MKKLLLTALCILMMNTSLFAWDIIPFTGESPGQVFDSKE